MQIPYLAPIQRSFGRHDITGIEAHSGEKAMQSTADLGAKAFTTRNHIVFGSNPNLRTAAHEAAHVVQQRKGVEMPSGIGRAGDPYERQADRVAERVVRGESVEAELGVPQAQGDVEARSVPAGLVVQREEDASKSLSPSSTAQPEEFSRPRRWARDWLEPLKATLGTRGMTSTDPEFASYNGVDQAGLESYWRGEHGERLKGFTSCNSFAGTYGRKALGVGGLGNQALYEQPGFIRVQDAGDRTPRYGDVLLHINKFHVAVSLGEAGRIESGQGGRKVGYDMMKYVSTPYALASLYGWVDLDLRFSTPWLGRWNVDDSTHSDVSHPWLYTFEEGGVVRYEGRDWNVGADSGTGHWRSHKGGGISVVWETGLYQNFPSPQGGVFSTRHVRGRRV